MRLRHLLISALILSVIFTGCMGTFETARVVPFKIGATCFTSIGDDEDDVSFVMPGIILEGGWPAGPGKFGIGLHMRAAGVFESGEDADNGFMFVWGGKVQLPQNSVADIAIGVDVWAYYPGELKLFLSKQLGPIEPYFAIGIAGFLNDDDDDDDVIVIDDGTMTYTAGTMIRFGTGSGWMLAAELEAGDVWTTPGVGFGLIKAF